MKNHNGIVVKITDIQTMMNRKRRTSLERSAESTTRFICTQSRPLILMQIKACVRPALDPQPHQ